jgi:hypothetical protein
MARDDNVLRVVLVGLNDYLMIKKGIMFGASNFHSDFVHHCENLNEMCV